MIKKLLNSRMFRIYMLLLLSVGIFTQLTGQTTYTWQGADLASWAVSTNWNPTRTTPATNDILQFNTGTTLTITAVPAQTVGRFLILNNTNITLQSTVYRALTIGNGSGTDFEIQSGSALILSTYVDINLAASGTADISGTLTVNVGRYYNTNGTSAVTTVNGTINNIGSISSTASSHLIFMSGSIYNHAQNGGTIPTATWDAASNCNFTGVLNAAPAVGPDIWQFYLELRQSDSQVNLNVTNTINGKFWVHNTNGKELRITSGVAQAWTVNDFQQDAGTLTMSSGTGIGTLNVAGNFSHTGGTITETGSSNGLIVFNKTGTQIYTSGGTVSNTINFTVNSGSTLQMAAPGTIITGAGTFTLSSGATLGITSADGITTVGTATGNIQTTTGRSFSVDANYTYNGGVDQGTGTGLPATIATLNIDNAGFTVTMDQSRSITGNLNILAGTFDLNTFTADRSASGGTLTIAGTLKLAGSSNFPANFTTMTLTGGTVEYNGLNTVTQTISAAPTYFNLVLTNGSGSGSALKTISSNIAIDNSLTVNSNCLFDLGTFTSDRTTSGGSLTIAGNMKLGGTNNFPANFTTMTLTGSSVEYNGLNSITQIISGAPVYDNLILTNGSGSGSAAKTISENTAINNDFTINSSCIFTIPASFGVTVAGTLTNNSGVAGLVIKSSATGTGSLIHNTAGVSGTVERHLKGNQWHIVSPSASGESINTFLTTSANNIPIFGSNYGMTDYNEGTSGWNSYFTSGTGGDLTLGTGYLLRNSADGVVTFPGTLRATALSVSIVRTVNGWNCIGNPFTSPLKIRGEASGSFLWDNAAQFQTGYAALYIYDPATPSYYKILNNTDVGGRYVDQDFVQPGQGFLVRAKTGGGTVDFTPAMRNQSSDRFYKKSAQNTDPWSKIILKAKASGQDVYTNILFRENMTRGIDEFYDAGLPDVKMILKDFGVDAGLPDKITELKLYSRLIEDIGINFAIQCLPDAETEDMIVPIGLDLPAGGLVTFNAENIFLPNGYKSILEDRQLGIFTDLKAQSAQYDAVIPAGTKGTGRFFLHTSLNSSSILKNDLLRKITSYAVDKEIFIKGQVSENTYAILYDLYGRKLKTVVLEPTDMNRFRVDDLNAGIYILKVEGVGLSEVGKLFIE